MQQKLSAFLYIRHSLLSNSINEKFHLFNRFIVVGVLYSFKERVATNVLYPVLLSGFFGVIGRTYKWQLLRHLIVAEMKVLSGNSASFMEF